MKLKTFLSIVSFGLCLIALLSLSYAWITMQNQGNAGGFSGSLDNPDVDVKLYYDDNNEWTLCTENLTIENLTLNNVKYFKLVLTAVSNESIQVGVSLTDVVSLVSDELLYENSTIYVTDREDNDLILYNVVNDKVMIGTNTLYNINNGNITLQDYKIENVVKLYIQESDNKSITGAEIKSLDEFLFTNQVLSQVGQTYTCYFGIGMDETACIVDDVDVSEYYQYQKLSIGKMIIRL